MPLPYDPAQRRALLLAIICAVIGCVYVTIAATRRQQAIVRTRRTALHTYDFWRYRVPAMPDGVFHRYFRLPRDVIRFLANDIKENLSPTSNHLSHPVELLVVIAIWRLAHASTLHLTAAQFDVGEATVDAASWMVLPFIVRQYNRKWVKQLWPSTEAARRKSARFFLERYGCGLPDVIGCIDGTHIPVTVPTGLHPEAFFSFKQFYSMLFLHVCDHMRRHIYISGGIPGSNGDNTILSNSDLYCKLSDHVPAPYHILGDGGIPLRPQIMTVYNMPRGGALTPAMVKFNHRLSNGRVLVEQAFGITKQRWRTFLGKGSVRFTGQSHNEAIDKYRIAWIAGCILHNMAVTRNAATGENADFERQLEADAAAYSAASLELEQASRAARNTAFSAGYAHDPASGLALEAGKLKRDELCGAMN